MNSSYLVDLIIIALEDFLYYFISSMAYKPFSDVYIFTIHTYMGITLYEKT